MRLPLVGGAGGLMIIGNGEHVPRNKAAPSDPLVAWPGVCGCARMASSNVVQPWMASAD